MLSNIACLTSDLLIDLARQARDCNLSDVHLVRVSPSKDRSLKVLESVRSCIGNCFCAGV